MKRKLLIAGGVAVLVLAGLAVAAVVALRDRPQGALDTELDDVTVIQAPAVDPPPPPPPAKRPREGNRFRFLPHDRVCWKAFGRTPQRSLSLPDVHLGRPTKRFWIRGLKSYMEFPPVYCDGRIYVNTVRGDIWAINAHNGNVVWRRRTLGQKPSSPAIDGPRLIVTSKAGRVLALRRSDGRTLWELQTRSGIESSPVVVDGTIYVGAQDGRLFALASKTGRIRWAYKTGGRINSSPSVHGQRVCVTNYAGAVYCLRRKDGQRLWSRYLARDVVRAESFYASASTDGQRLYTIARSGRVMALNAANGRTVWSHRLNSLGYSTPAVAHGRVFVGDFNGYLRAYRASTGRELWRRRVPGRILAPPMVVGKLVFFSTLEQKTYAARVADGHVVWRVNMGKYSPGIATDRHYFFSLNGILVAYHARFPAKYKQPSARNSAQAAKRREAQGKG